MIFHTKEDFLLNLKVGDTFWLVGTRMKHVQEPEGPFKIQRFYKRTDDSITKVAIDPIYMVHRTHFISDFHHGYKITATTLEEAETYFAEQRLMEKTDLDRKVELAEAIAISRID